MRGALFLLSLTYLGLTPYLFMMPAQAQDIRAQVPVPDTLPETPNLLPIAPDVRPPSARPLPDKPVAPALPPPSELLQTPGQAPAESPTATPDTIIVKQFKVTGSTVFSDQDFAKITQAFTNRPITQADLLQVRTAVTQLYVSQGYITSGAYIAPQAIQDGVVEIRVVEGKLEDIIVGGTRRLNPGYIRSRLGLAGAQPLNQTRLLEGLQLLQLNPLLQNLSAELAAGTRVGQNVLKVQVAEAKTFTPQITLDNNRSPSVGTARRLVQVTEANLLGLGDTLSVSYTNTNGSNAGNLSYTMPVSPRNSTISFSYGISSSRVLEKPFDLLEIESKSRYYELTFRQPLIQKPSQELAVGITATRQESEATFLNGELPFLARGSDAEGKTAVTSIRLFQDWVHRSDRQLIALRSQFSFGLDALNATINPEAPDGRFFSWRGQAQWVRLLAPETLLLVRGDLQFADRPLPSLEQFTLGGQDSVRGYRQDALVSDSGLFLSAEARVPIWRFGKPNHVLQVVPFADFGLGWNSFDDTAASTTLASVGLGLRLQLGDRVAGRLDWGIPLSSRNLNGDRDTLQERGFYFSLTVRP
jgi:hemolysin activation/secretion protein